MASKEQALAALLEVGEFIKGLPDSPKPGPTDPEPPKPEPPKGNTMAEIIDEYFKAKNYYPQVVFHPIGAMIVDIALNQTGDDNLWPETLATACEIEGGGKNILGCDQGAQDCHKPVTKGAIDRLIAHYHETGVSNGIGPMQITWFPFVQKAQNMGGAQFMRNSITVGAQYLNDLLNKYAYLDALETYNDGRPGNDPNNPYEVKFSRVHVEWRNRLREASDYRRHKDDKPGVKPSPPTGPTTPPKPSKPSWDPVNGKLSPPGFTPLAPRPGNYTDLYPTRFQWREDIEQVVRDLYAEFGKYRIFVNTYVRHPAEANPPRPNVSLDVWGGGGDRPGRRGLWLPSDLGDEVWKYLWSDKTPRIRWGIYREKIYGVWNNWNPEPFGNGSQFTAHRDHIHISFDGPFEQIR